MDVLGKVAVHAPVLLSQALTMRLPATVSTVLLSVAEYTQCKAAAGPLRVWRQLPDCTSHTIAQPSAATDTAVAPSADTLMLWTRPA